MSIVFVRAMRRLSAIALLLTGWLTLSAHVGTNQVVFEGRAGGYPIRVMINPPGVVPAQVPITVRVLDGSPTRVTVRAAQWNVGTKGAPPAEQAAIVPGDAGVWAHDLWIMTSSTYAVHIAVEGPAGNGTVIVPLQTSATRTLGMQRGMAAILIVLGTLLVAGFLTIVGAAAREGSLPAGERPTAARRRTARIATASTAALLALALLGGSKWWDAEERDYKRRMFKPIPMTSAVRTVDGDRVLSIAITDSLWRSNRSTPLMPDHGKLMHLFLIRADDANAIAHLHPLRVHADTFVTRIPAVPEGRYLLYGDLLFQSGSQRTLVDTVDLPVAPVVAGEAASAPRPAQSNAPSSLPAMDADDAWRVVSAMQLGTSSPLASGGSITLEADLGGNTAAKSNTSIVAGRDLRLVVTVLDADGKASTLQPYMGMGGHAMVLRRDAGVFMHLHPMGTASMTAQAQLLRREQGDTAMLDAEAIAVAMRQAAVTDTTASPMHEMHAAAAPATGAAPLAFPFSFPSEGAYRVFVQVKRNNVVETAAFDVVVAPSVKPAP